MIAMMEKKLVDALLAAEAEIGFEQVPEIQYA